MVFHRSIALWCIVFDIIAFAKGGSTVGKITAIAGVIFPFSSLSFCFRGYSQSIRFFPLPLFFFRNILMNRGIHRSGRMGTGTSLLDVVPLGTGIAEAVRC